MKKLLQLLLFMVSGSGAFPQTALPRADFEHTFYMFPIFEEIRMSMSVEIYGEVRVPAKFIKQ